MPASRIPAPKARRSRPSTPVQRTPSAASSPGASGTRSVTTSSPPTSFRSAAGTSSSAGRSAGNRSSVGSADLPSAAASSSRSSSAGSSAGRRASSSRPSSRVASPERRPSSEAGPAPLPPDFVQAAFDFVQSDDPTYLSFRKGQLIRVLTKDASGWWNGELEGRQAWFPSNYVLSLDGPLSASMTRRSSYASTMTSDSSSADSTAWDRRPSGASSLTSSTSESSAGPSPSSQHTLRDPGPSRPSSRQSTTHRQRAAERPTSPPRQSNRRPSDVRTPPRPHGSRVVSASSTRGTAAILESITTAVSLLHSAVAADRISHFNPSTACVISSVRSVLSATDCLPKDSPLLKLHPALARERKTILAELSKLVGQSRLASAETLPDGGSRADEMEKMLSMARRLLAGVRAFLTIAIESGVALPDRPDVVDSSDDSVAKGSSSSDAHDPHSAALAAMRLDPERTPLAPGPRRQTAAPGVGPASGRRLLEALDQAPQTQASEPAVPTPAADEDDVAEAKTAHEELLVIISAFIGQVYAPAGAEETALVAHLLEVAHECLRRVLRIVAVVDRLRPRLADHSATEQLEAARAALFAACSHLVDAADELGEACRAGSLPVSGNDCRIRLLGGATSTLRTAASCAKVVAERTPSAADGSGMATTAAGDPPEDVAALARQGADLVRLRDQLEKSRAVTAARGSYPRGMVADRRSVDSLSLSSSVQSESGEDLTIRATLPIWSENEPHDVSNDGLDDDDVALPTADRRHSAISWPSTVDVAESVRTEGSLSHSTQTVSSEATLPSPRGSTDSLDRLPALVRRSSAESLDLQAPIEELKTPLIEHTPLSTPTGFPQRPRATTLASSPKPPLKLSDPPFVMSAARPSSTDGRLWLLGHDYDPTELALGSDGGLIGASLPALVEKLTPHDTSIVDPALLDMFFLCFRLFTTPAALVGVLAARFEMDGPAGATVQPQEYTQWMANKAAPVRIRIFGFLKLWLEAHWRADVDADALPLLETFAQGPLREALPSVAPRLLHAIRLRSQPSSPEHRTGAPLHKSQSSDRLPASTPQRIGGAPVTTLPPTPQITRGLFQALRNPHGAVSVTDFDPLELARQITVMEAKLFAAVKPHEVVESVRRSSPSLKAMSHFNTQLMSLVSDTILTERDVKKRAAALKFFIKLANRLLDVRNFSAAFAVVGSLNGSSITRLKKTWEALSTKTKLAIAALRHLFDSSRNHANYRARLRATGPPALPFLGIVLSDVTFCSDGNPSTRRSPLAPDKQLINLAKYNGLWRIVADVRRFQAPFALAEVPEVQIFLSKVFAEKDSTSIEHLYRKSLSVEPRTSTTPAPGLP